MKKVLLVIIVMCTINAVFGQTYNRYRGITIGIGPRFVNTSEGILVTSFIDNSPAPDNLMSVTEIEDGYTNLGFSLGYKFGSYNGLAHDIDVDITFGNAGDGGMVTYGLGWNFPTMIGGKDLLIRPSLFAGFGNFGFDVGDLENNTGFIQIGETIYSEPALDVSLKSSVLIYGPAIDLVYKVADRVDVFISAHYDIGSDNRDTNVIFTSQVDNSNSSTLSLNDENPSVLYNEEELKSLPYEISGIRLQIGASYLWNRD